MAHYMMDRYFPDATKPSGFRRESARLVAMGDDEAISEVKRFGHLNGSKWYELRRVWKKGDLVIYSSKVKA